MRGIYPKKDTPKTFATIPKLKRFIAGLLIAIMLGDQLAFLELPIFQIPAARAAGDDRSYKADKQLGLIALIVQKELLEDGVDYPVEGGGTLELGDGIETLAQSMQARTPHSQAMIITVDEESPLQIATALEKLYYEGDDPETDNRLIGAVFIGDVPMPVVMENGQPTPSLYPYTDFYRKRYIYNHQTGRYEPNSQAVAPTPDIWHGVMAPPEGDTPEGRAELAQYLHKNARFSAGDDDFARFEKRLLYTNLPEIERKLNPLDYNNYRRWLTYFEEIAFQRFNKNLLRDLAKKLEAEFGTSVIDDATIDGVFDNAVRFIFEKYTASYAEGLRTHIGKVSDKIEETGRYQREDYDSAETLISMRDKYMETILLGKTVALEKAVDEAVQKVDEPLLLPSAVTIDIRGCRDAATCTIDDREEDPIRFIAYLAGRPVGGITNVRQCGFLRGQKPAESESILQNNSVQVEANRLYNPQTTIIPNKVWIPDPRNPLGTDKILVDGDDDDPPQERDEYKNYAGCVGNNAIVVRDEETGIPTAMPGFCNPDKALAPLFDIRGSRAIENGPEGQFSYCDPQFMIFHPAEDTDDPDDLLDFYDDEVVDVREDTIVPDTGDIADSLAGIDYIDLNFEEFILGDPEEGAPGIYAAMKEDGLITGNTGSKLKQVAAVIRGVLQNGGMYRDAVPINSDNTAYFEMRVTPEWHPIGGSLEKHTEPTDLTLDEIRKAQVTPSIPADGIRHVRFRRGDQEQVFDYVNLFRVEGKNPEAIAENLLRTIFEKDAELNAQLNRQEDIVARFFIQNSNLISPGDDINAALENLVQRIRVRDELLNGRFGRRANVLYEFFDDFKSLIIPSENPYQPAAELYDRIRQRDIDLNGRLDDESANVIARFFLENSALTEPTIWRGLSIDQKYEWIQYHYLDRNSNIPVLPADGETVLAPPAAKPNGYEIWHLNAEGDETGYRYGVHAAMWKAEKPAEDRADEEAADVPRATQSGGQPEAEQSFLCGDPTGVEIWEWFDAVQCWIQNEILPAHELFELDNSCGGDLPAPAPTEPWEDPIQSSVFTPAQINVVMPARTLVRGQTIPIQIQPLNSSGEVIVGYIPEPAHFELSDDKIGAFAENDLKLFTGQGESKFTANRTGQATLRVAIGSVQSIPITLRVVDEIQVRFQPDPLFEQQEGRQFYEIQAYLTEKSGTPVTNVHAQVRLQTAMPLAGAFEHGGAMDIVNGEGRLVFYPNPAEAAIGITAAHPVYVSQTLSLAPPPSPPHHIVVRGPFDVNGNPTPFIEVGQTAELKIEVVSASGLLTPAFSGLLSVEISEDSKTFVSLDENTVAIQNGAGVMAVTPQGETGFVKLHVSHPALVPTDFQTDILSRVSGDEVAARYPQNLFASFVGFAGGNFLKPGYFAGRHLFSGKTEAVFGLMDGPRPMDVAQISPRYKIRFNGNNKRVNALSAGDALHLSGVDQRQWKTLFSAKIPLNFSQVSLWDEDAPLTENALYIEPSKGVATVQVAGDTVELFDALGNPIAHFTKNRIDLVDSQSVLAHETSDEWDGLELSLRLGAVKAAHLRFNFAPVNLAAADFNVHRDYVTRPLYSGSSTHAPKGLALYNLADKTPESPYGSDFGFRGENKYLIHIAGGTPVGEAVRYNLPVEGVLLGDPTISIVNRPVGAANYDNTVGRKLFQNPDGGNMTALTHLDFNNDGYEDVAALSQSGHIRLMEGGPTEPAYRYRGDIAHLADKAIAIEAFDLQNDGYDDLLAATAEGRLAILNNDRGVITRTDQKLQVGKQLYTLLKGDMDLDGQADLVTLDSRGDVRIFYNEGGVFPEIGVLLGNYGFSLKNGDLGRDLKIRYSGLREPSSESADDFPPPPIQPKPHLPALGLSPGQIQALNDFAKQEEPTELDGDKSADYVKGLADRAKQAVEAVKNGGAPPLLPWPSPSGAELPAAATDYSSLGLRGSDIPPAMNSESYFAPVADVSFVDATKNVRNKERPEERDLDLGETLVYTITLTPYGSLNDVVVADTVPDALTVDTKTAACQGLGCENFTVTKNGILLFFSGMNWRTNQPITITYEAKVRHTPRANIFLKKLNDPGISDAYLDLVVYPPFNSRGIIVHHYSTDARVYKSKLETPETEPLEPPPPPISPVCQAMMDTVQRIAEQGNGVPSFITAQKDAVCAADMAAMEAQFKSITKPTGCGPEGMGGDADCARDALNDFADAMNDFACMGGGCFPNPVNEALLVPGGPSVAFPIFAFPTTFFTPVGPIPLFEFFGVPAPIGMTLDFPGPIQSMFRLYMSPTLTGGIGIAMCFGPYTGNVPVTPPIAPIPYPPPQGNCIVKALPMSEMPLCKLPEKLMDKAVRAIRKIKSDIEAEMASITGDDSPMAMETTDTQGAGGLEISLSLDFGEHSEFEPPVNGFSNLKIPSFDALQGVISGWVDRQAAEIINKVFTLPEFSILLPDVKSLWSVDWDRTNKLWDTILESYNTESWDANAEALADTYEGSNIETNAEGETSRSIALSDVDNLFTAPLAAVADQARLIPNPLEQLYDLANSFPFLEVNEQPIEFKIPWLSAEEIMDMINELELWVGHMKREVERVKDVWGQWVCVDNFSLPNIEQWAADAGQTPQEWIDEQARAADTTADQWLQGCRYRQVADMILQSVTPVIASVEANIQALQTWLIFPRKIIAFYESFANYLKAAGCVLETYAQMFGGWWFTIQEQMVSWAELYYTIIAIAENISELFDLFVNFNDSCEICTNERFANFGWYSLLGLVIPEIPIIKLPKWPDIVLDLSELDVKISLDLPLIKFTPEPIEFPRLPYLDFPDIPFPSFALQLPPLPILPTPPELPELPELPPIPKLNLPTLPAPPKLPDLGVALEVIVPLIEQILQAFCLLKKGLAPVPEGYLATQIRTLTNRPNYLIPLDILKPKFPDIAPFDLGFNEVRIETQIQIGSRISVIFDELAQGADSWNRVVEEEIVGVINKGMEEAQRQMKRKTDEWQAEMDAAQAAIEDAFLKAEDWVQENVQEPLNDAAEWSQEQTDAMQDPMDEATEAMRRQVEEWQTVMDQEMVDTFTKLNETIRTGTREWSEEIREFWNTKTGQLLHDVLAHQLTLGTATVDSLLEKYDVELDDLIEGTRRLNELMREESSGRIPGESYHNPDYQRLAGVIGQIGDVIRQANASQVDYRVIKEKLGVPDVRVDGRKTPVDKINWMRDQLKDYGATVMARAEELRGTRDLMAFVETPPSIALDNVFAVKNTPARPSGQTTTSAIRSSSATADAGAPRRVAQAVARAADEVADSFNEEASDELPCRGACIVNMATDEIIEIPSFDNIGVSQTVFVPNAEGASHDIVYSDGPALYVKKDLTAAPSEVNQTGRVQGPMPLTQITHGNPPMEAVNMLTAAFTRDGASKFTWLDTTNPLRYGYGVELQRFVQGFDADRKNHPFTKVKIILLPVDEEGNTPEVLADGKPIDYRTMVTTLSSQSAADEAFGLSAKTVVTGARRVTFPTVVNVRMTLDDRTAFYFEEYKEPNYTLKMENGFYQVRMNWFDRFGRVSNANQNELVAPQPYSQEPPPIAKLKDNHAFTVPQFKALEIRADQIFADPFGTYEYAWDIDADNTFDQFGDTFNLPAVAQKEPRVFSVNLIASQDFERFPKPEDWLIKPLKVEVYTPKIELDGETLKTDKMVEGVIKPKSKTDDVSEIPFSLFRQRWNTWKNLGRLKEKIGDPTAPSLSERSGLKDSYFSGAPNADKEAPYRLQNFTVGPPSNIIVKDSEATVAARVLAGSGQIELLNRREYRLQALPASADLPTRVAIVEKTSGQILSNVHYTADGNTDIKILEEPLTPGNAASIGVTVGDADPADDIIAHNIPGYGPSYPGGVAIFNETPPQVNVALVNTNGTIRMMQAGYSLRLKNEGALKERPIFQIISENGEPVFDIYIQADFRAPEIRQEEIWGVIAPTIGRVKDAVSPWLALFTSVRADETRSPFPDLTPAHPYFESILNLYKRRVISGYGDGQFRPDGKLSRAEFVKIALGVTNCFDCTAPSQSIRDRFAFLAPFPDTKLPAWYYFCIAIAKELGMITGYGDGFFRPDRNISRAEAAAILIRQSKIPLTEAPDEFFIDVPDYAWYRNYVYTAVEIGLVKNKSGFVFPDEEITRGEFAFMAAGVLNLQECIDIDSDRDTLPDSWEMPANLDPLTGQDAGSDADGDGLTAVEEYQLGTNPNSADTDADGIPDPDDDTPHGDGPPFLSDRVPGVAPGPLTDEPGGGAQDQTGGIAPKPPVLTDTGEICPCADNPNQNDTDGDSVIDACDTDVDADGTENALCLFDNSGLLAPAKVRESADNCLFIENADQADGDMNGRGDICEESDVCPPVPEDWDGVGDVDGCPEVVDNLPDTPPGVIVNRGPLCYFLDYEADLMPGDIIMTGITDTETHETIFETSNQVQYE